MGLQLLSVQNVGFVVDNKRILEHVSLEVEEGEYLTLTGTSGSGKSTLLKLIASLLSVSSGSIVFGGKNIQDYSRTAYRRLVSYCFQQPTLFGRTVRDCLAFPFTIRNLDFDEKKVCERIEAMRLPAVILNQEITQLSGGERQRIALARNLLFTPSILLLDEVSAGLDAETQLAIHELIAECNRQAHVTVISVTHNETEIEQAEHLLVLENNEMSVLR